MVIYHKRAIGAFPTRLSAEYALTELQQAAFDMKRVSVIARDARHGEVAGTEITTRPNSNQAAEGAATGAVTGGALGGLTGLLVGLGALTIPGVGPLLLGGAVATALATTLSGGAIGAAAGTLIGALLGLGVPEDQAKIYSDRISRGEYLVIVEGTELEIMQAESILRHGGIQDWGIYDMPTVDSSRTEYATSDFVHRDVQ